MLRIMIDFETGRTVLFDGGFDVDGKPAGILKEWSGAPSDAPVEISQMLALAPWHFTVGVLDVLGLKPGKKKDNP